MEEKMIEGIIGEAVGKARGLWIKPDGAFDSTKGIKITNKATLAIKALIKERVSKKKELKIRSGKPKNTRFNKFILGFNYALDEFLKVVEGL